MNAKCEDENNWNGHNNEKPDLTLKRESVWDIEHKSIKDSVEDEYDEFQNSETVLKTFQNSFAQIKQEQRDQNGLNIDHRTIVKEQLEPQFSYCSLSNPNHETSEIEIQHLIPQIKQETYSDVPIKQDSDNDEEIEQDLHEGVEIKQEPADPEMKKELEELYADHEVKEDLVLGLEVLQHSGPPETVTYSNEVPMRSYKKRRRSPRLKLRKKELKPELKPELQPSHVCKICNKLYKYKAWLEKHLEEHLEKHSEKHLEKHSKKPLERNPSVSHQKLKIRQRNYEFSSYPRLGCKCGKLFYNKFVLNWHKSNHCKYPSCKPKKYDSKRSNLITRANAKKNSKSEC